MQSWLLRSLTCQEFSFKPDTSPTAGGCWLFNKADVDVEADAKAVTGSKECQDPAIAAAVSAAAEKVEGVAGAVTGTAAAGVNTVADGVNGAASAVTGTAQAGVDSVTSGINGVAGTAQGHMNTITDGIGGVAGSVQGHMNGLTNGLTGAASSITGTAQNGVNALSEGASGAVDGIKVNADGKSLVADGSGSDHTLLYCILGGSAAAVPWLFSFMCRCDSGFARGRRLRDDAWGEKEEEAQC